MFDETKPTSIHESGSSESVEIKDYCEFFEACYSEADNVVLDNVSDGDQVVDIGCGKGHMERLIGDNRKNVFLTCVDSDRKSLESIVEMQEEFAKNGTGNYIDLHYGDANMFLHETPLTNQDTTILIAVMHEINDPDHRQQYLEDFFKQLSKITGKRAIIGDYYYADSVSDEEVSNFMEFQKSKIGHADARHKFVKPEELIQASEGSDFRVVSNNVIRAVEEIERYFYLMVLEKK